MKLLKLCFLIAAFLTASLGQSQQCFYPDLIGISKPNPEPTPPGDIFLPPVDNSTPVVGVPIFAEWTRQANPDDNIIATGYNFTTNTGTSSGKDTRFLVYGRSANSGNVLLDGNILRLDGSDKLTLTLNAGLPTMSMYLIWPKNSIGWGRPITVNQTQATWLGPNKATRGQTISVFGQNLSHNKDTLTSWVYIKPSGGSGQWTTVTRANPYKIDFTVPTGLANGIYEVWVHNGHGGKYGWSGPQMLTVENAMVWTGTVYNVKNYGATGNGTTNDAAAIQAALNAANTSGSRVYFPAGTYKINSFITIPGGVWVYGDGKSTTTLLRGSNSTGGSDNCTIIFENQSNIKISDMTIDGSTLGGWYDRLIRQRSTSNIWYTNCKIIARNFVSIDNASSSYQYWINCEFRQNSVFQNGKQFFVTNCNFYGTYDSESALNYWGVSEASVVNCTFKNEDYTKPEGVLVRMLVSNFAWGESRLCYFGDNIADKIGQINDPGADQNKGEQFCWEGSGADYIGSPSSATSTSITFNDANASDPGQSIMVLNGQGIGQARQITGSSRNGSSITINFAPALNVVPNTSSKVGYGRWFNNIVIYRNKQSGRDDIFKRYTAQCAVQFYGGSYNNIIDNNTYNHLRAGVQFWSIADGSNWKTVGSSYFSLVKDNNYTNVEYGLGDRPIGGDATTFRGTVPMLGIIFRNNSITDNIGGVTNQAINGTDALGDMSLYEHNTVTNIPNAIGSSNANSNNQLFYKNSANRGSAPLSGSKAITFSQGTNPAFVGNVYTGYATVYSGTAPEAILELPQRNFEIPLGGIVPVALPIANSGTSSLTWSASSNSVWAALSATSGNINAEGNANVTLTCNTEGLAIGSIATITVTAGIQTKIVTVKIINCTTITSVNLISSDEANAMKLFPNPAFDNTVVSYQLSENSDVKISVCDVIGKEVKGILNERQTVGEHTVNINTGLLQSGIYFVKMNMNGQHLTQKLIVNK